MNFTAVGVGGKGALSIVKLGEGGVAENAGGSVLVAQAADNIKVAAGIEEMIGGGAADAGSIGKLLAAVGGGGKEEAEGDSDEEEKIDFILIMPLYH